MTRSSLTELPLGTLAAGPVSEDGAVLCQTGEAGAAYLPNTRQIYSLLPLTRGEILFVVLFPLAVWLALMVTP